MEDVKRKAKFQGDAGRLLLKMDKVKSSDDESENNDDDEEDDGAAVRKETLVLSAVVSGVFVTHAWC